MKQLIIYLLLLLFAMLALLSCTNDEGNDSLEVLTPNDTTETGIVQPVVKKDTARETIGNE